MRRDASSERKKPRKRTPSGGKAAERAGQFAKSRGIDPTQLSKGAERLQPAGGKSPKRDKKPNK